MSHYNYNCKYTNFQSGTECFCGNNHYTSHSLNCWNANLIKCPGNQSEVCGGKKNGIATFRGETNNERVNISKGPSQSTCRAPSTFRPTKVNYEGLKLTPKESI